MNRNKTLIVLLIILIFLACPAWPYAAGLGFYPFGGLIGVLVIILLLSVLGVI